MMCEINVILSRTLVNVGCMQQNIFSCRVPHDSNVACANEQVARPLVRGIYMFMSQTPTLTHAIQPR